MSHILRIAVAMAATATLQLTAVHAAELTAEVLTYAAGAPIPVALTLAPAEKGGPKEPLRGSKPVKVKFPGDARTYSCLIEVGTQTTAEPGQTHNVGMTCEEAVAVAHDGMEFVVHDGGREVGKGKITPT